MRNGSKTPTVTGGAGQGGLIVKHAERGSGPERGKQVRSSDRGECLALQTGGISRASRT
jgi:hypothetical protein